MTMQKRKSFGRAPSKAQIALATSVHVDVRGKSGDELMKEVRLTQQKNRIGKMPVESTPNVTKFNNEELQSKWEKFQNHSDSSDYEADFIEEMDKAKRLNRL